MTISRVLVATDFSQTSDSAIAWAIAIAKAHGASIHLVHSIPPAMQITPDAQLPPAIDRTLQQESTTRLEAAAAQIRTQVEATSELLNEVPWRGICQAASEASADLVVVGTQGLSGLEHLLLGSSAERVIQHAPCPVLAVHASDRAPGPSIARILVPTDFSTEARVAAETALDLLHGAQPAGELILVHAYHLPLEYGEYAVAVTAPDLLKELAETAESQLEEWAGELRGKGWKVSTESREGTPSSVVQQLAEDLDVDLIAMGTHGRSGFVRFFLGSTVKRVLPATRCPILTVRQQTE